MAGENQPGSNNQPETPKNLTNGVEQISNQQWLTDKIGNLKEKPGINATPTPDGEIISAGLDAPAIVISYNSDGSQTVVSIKDDITAGSGKVFVLEGDSVNLKTSTDEYLNLKPGEDAKVVLFPIGKLILEKDLNNAGAKMIASADKDPLEIVDINKIDFDDLSEKREAYLAGLTPEEREEFDKKTKEDKKNHL